VLCPSTQDPLDQVLPALTSSPNVDLELYALIAVIFRDFVHKWYGQITSDTAFVDEVVTVVAHVTRALEERLRKVTLKSPIISHQVQQLIVGRLRSCYPG
jgi:sorting nexin-19